MRTILWVGVLMLVTPSVTTAQQGERVQGVRIQADTITMVRRPFVRDTLRIRELTAANESEVLRVVNEIRAREAGILQALATIPPARVAERRALEEELAKLSREAFTVMSVVESRCVESRTSAPPGYLGLTVTTDVVVRDRSVNVQRSVVSSVEPGSPAERAGLASGDVIVSIAGRDAMVRFPEISEFLEPGRRIEVRAERNGRPIGVVVTVAPRPQRFDRGCPLFDRAMQPLRLGGVARFWVQDSTDGQGNRVMYMVTAPTPPNAPAVAALPRPATAPQPATPRTPAVAATAPTPPTPPSAPAVVSFGTTMGGASNVGYFAGAQFRALDDDWRAVLGLKPGTTGVLVNEVAPGSAAAQSGLRVGDVVTQIDGTAASSPLVVVRLLGLNEETQASLRVVRAREARVVQLRWGRR
jgi:membrane-associated protease RseP (regulator of RpoE activity)